MTFPKTRNWRFNARYGALALLAMSVSACSLEERKTARVVIDLSELRSDRVAASRWDASSVNATAMSTPAQPTWGNGGRASNTSLASYDQLHCVMLNVMGEGIPSVRPDWPATRPEKWDQNNICSYVYPGTHSIPTRIDQTTIELSVSVQKGTARLVQLIGFMKPVALRCEDITLPMMMPGGVVGDRYELGITKVDLMSDTTVEIQGNIASAKLIKGCGGPQGAAVVISGYSPYINLDTIAQTPWTIKGSCDLAQVDAVELLNDQNVLVASTQCQNTGFTISASGTLLAGDGSTGQKTFSLRALKNNSSSGSDLTFTVTRDLEYPDVTSASLTTSDSGIANPNFTITLQGASEAATILLLRGDTTCQAATTVGSSSIGAGQQNFNQTFTVAAPQGTSRYFIGIKDAAGNLNCPPLNGGSPNFVEYTNSSGPYPRGEILALGGQDSNSGSALTVEVFSKITGSRITSSYSPLPTDGAGYTGWMESAGVKLPDGSILIAGGRNLGAVPHNLAYRLVPGTLAWQGVTPLNVARYGHTMTVIPWSGEVVVIGGADEAGNALVSVEVYDPVTKAFKLLNSQFSVGRYGHAAQLLVPTGGGMPSIAVIGGRSSVGDLSSVTNLVNRVAIVQGSGWTVSTNSFPGLPVGLSMHRATSVANSPVLTVTGGFLSSGVRSDVSYMLDTNNLSASWGSVTMGAGRAEHVMATLQSDSNGVRYFAFGGGGAFNDPMMGVLSSNGSTYSWSAFSPLNFSTVLSTLRGAGIARLDWNDGTGNEKFLILGGKSSSATFNPYGLIVTTPASGNAQMTSTEYQHADPLTTSRSDFLLLDF